MAAWPRSNDRSGRAARRWQHDHFQYRRMARFSPIVSSISRSRWLNPRLWGERRSRTGESRGSQGAVLGTVGLDGSSREVGSIKRWPVGGAGDLGDQIRIAGAGVVVEGAADDGFRDLDRFVGWAVIHAGGTEVGDECVVSGVRVGRRGQPDGEDDQR